MSTVGAVPAGLSKAPPPRASAPKLEKSPAVKGVSPVASHFVKQDDQAAKRYQPTAINLPSAGSATVDVKPANSASSRFVAPKSPTTVPVSLHEIPGSVYTGPSSAQVAVKDQAVAAKAGVNGMLFTVTPTQAGQGLASVSLDYSSFAEAYGGNFGSRLQLVRLPACVLTTPELAACRTRTPLASANNAVGRTLSAKVQLEGDALGVSSRAVAGSSITGGDRASAGVSPVVPSSMMVLAAISSATPDDGGGAKGTYAATSLSASGSWTSGGSNGSFNYSYPISAPSAPSSLAPKLSLNYDSGSVDGKTATSQAQSSWIGEGWSMPESFIERSFVPCNDNPGGSPSPSATYDQCYAGDVLTLSLNGSSTSLVPAGKDGAGNDVYKAADDGGEIVTHLVNTGNGSLTYNTDYWTVRDRSANVYSFGLNHLPGWSAGKNATNSVNYLPVYSAHSGDPCYNASGFSSSVCTMASRWSLDYVTDVRGNAMSYYYKQDINHYGQNKGASDGVYIRDSHLDHIDYGFTNGNAYGTVPDQVVFVPGDRCVTAPCSPLSSTTKANWLDVPYDLVCGGTACSSQSPAFFSTVRLASVTTQQWDAASSAFKPVDSWKLDQTMPKSGDGGATLWLSKVTRTGKDLKGGGSSGDLPLPEVSFGGIDLQNRVNTSLDGLPALYRWRISSVTTESGSVIGVQYTQPSPCTAPVTTSPSDNSSSCFPVNWTPSGYPSLLDWFNKYVVDKVTQTDPTGSAPVQATSYKYLGAAWHFDDNEVVQPKYRTYGQWRGYGSVKTFTGDGVNDKRTMSEVLYYQGMSNNNNSTAVTLTDSQGGKHDDANLLSGRSLEETAYTGENGTIDHSTVTSYWVSDATATRTRSGLPDLTANRVAPVESWSRQALTSTGSTTWRVNETDTTYNTTTTDANFGLVTAVYSHTVPVNTTYDRCTTTTYAVPNAAINLMGLVAATETDSVACDGFTQGTVTSVPGSVNTLKTPANVTRSAQVVSATRTFYDVPAMAAQWPQPASPAFPQTSAPTLGDPSVVQTFNGALNGVLTYVTAATQVRDAVGRPTVTYDAKGAKTSRVYTTDAAGLVTGVRTTNPLNQATSTKLDPARGLTLTATDANQVVTTSQYDALGRVTGIWLASRATADPANYVYEYLVSNSGVSAVTTKKLNDELYYQVSTLIYDAQLRPRQTQSPTPQSGRMVTDTFYDTHGWASAKYNGWWDAVTLPNTTLVSAANLKDQVPNQDYYSYDGLGRVVVDKSEKNNVVVSTTTTVYSGDRTTVIPPTGGTVKTTVTNPIGQTVERDDYTTRPTLNPPVDTFNGIYTVSGGVKQAITYGFDIRGNQNKVTAGGSSWTSVFNPLGQVTSKTDPDAGTSQMKYDAAGLLTQSTDSRGKVVSYTYDALGRKTGSYAAANTAQSSANQLASWVYDNSDDAAPGMMYPIGHLTTTTSYSNSAAYVTQEIDFDIFGNSLGQDVTIPGTTDAGALGGTKYSFTHMYTSNTGLPLLDSYPSGGGLPSEDVMHGYAGNLDLPSTLGGNNGYTQQVIHDAYGRVQQETIGSGSNEAYITNTFDDHTGRLKDQLVTRSTATPTNVDEQAYTYDLAGNITKQVETRLGSSTSTETQCYKYDSLDRLSQAWTATDSCAATPTTTAHAMVGDGITGGAYWTSWSFDALGNRTSQVEHSTTGGTDTTTAYTYNGNGAGQAHTLTSTAASGGSTATTSYRYDTAGNTTTRTTPTAGNQTLSWDDAGRLNAITGGTAGDSKYVYNADGTVLLQKDPDTTTLYLPGQQLTLTSTGGRSGTRYYPLPGGGTAVRTGTVGGPTTYTFEIPDQHGTAGLALDATCQTPTWRQFTPYGAPRGTATTWADNRTFLNAPTSPSTGLTTLGVRQYDPLVGRFISLDPVFESIDAQQLGGYNYASSNPITGSDPTGLMNMALAEGGDATGTSSDDSGGQEDHPHKHGFRGFLSGGWSTVKGAFGSGVKPFRDVKGCVWDWKLRSCGQVAIQANPVALASKTAYETALGVKSIYKEYQDGDVAYANGQVATMLILAAITKKITKGPGAAAVGSAEAAETSGAAVPRELSAGPNLPEPANLYGPYHRRFSPDTQNAESMRLIEDSGELWGGESKVFPGEPIVMAHDGPLPIGQSAHSFEFYTTVEPIEMAGSSGRNSPPGYRWWPASEPGVGLTADGLMARIPIVITNIYRG